MNQFYTEKGNKPKVLMYYTFADKIGGPLTYINTIINSKLQEVFQFKTLFQEKAPGGLDLGLLKDMVTAIKAENPDVLHVHGVQSEGFYGVLAGKLAGCKKIIMTVHGLAFDDSIYHGVKKFLYKNIIEPWAIRNCDKLYCVCEFTSKRDIIKNNAKKSGNLGHIHNPAPDLMQTESREDVRKRLSLTDDDVVFCIASRLSREKGFDILVDIVKEAIIKTDGKFKLLVLGDGNYGEEFKKELNEEIKNNNVIMVGRTDRVADYLYASDGFVFPSYHENLSIALLEACKAGIPSVVSFVGGNPEVIENGVNGFTIKEFNVNDYVEKIVTLTQNSDLRKAMGNKAKEIADTKFSADFIFGQIEKAYKE